ncbi:hypothetical protein CWI80_08080 [Pseudidiomarina sediminum]|uniref:Uncharacterized protein n=1 Tax=Pseudidiomarina sediminum TaxID=431675 RepID=A0A432Z3P0_9GAMM|nr:hypothetical protein [Pseudidiomarina sediminum]RUO72500.1 hypothetical protein CWI80_08080 [Pseudidiomarina sediminum]
MNDKDILENQITVWKEIVETQRHFNDVAMKVRHLGFILVAALVGAAGLTFRSGYEMTLTDAGFSIPVASALLMFGALFWVVIWFLDVKWYTPFLLGSVKAGLLVESEINRRMTEVQLTQHIKKASADSSILGIQLSSSRRAPLFHTFMFLLLSGMSVLLACFNNIETVSVDLTNETQCTDSCDESHK